MNRFSRLLMEDRGQSDFTPFDRYLDRAVFKGPTRLSSSDSPLTRAGALTCGLSLRARAKAKAGVRPDLPGFVGLIPPQVGTYNLGYFQ